MKKLLKSRRFISALLTVVFIGFGVNHVGIAPVVTEAVCARVQCDA